jgi:hypothetical protein
MALALAGCGGDGGDETAPLDPDAVRAAVEDNVEVTQFCEPDQLALEPGESVTCPAIGRTDDGLVEGDLELRRESDEQELTYEVSMTGPGGNKVGGGTFTVDGDEAGGTATVAAGSPLERHLSESLDGAEIDCSSEAPPAKGETVTCTASGEDEDGEAFDGEVTVQRSEDAGASGAPYAYEATLEKEGGGTRFSGGVFDLD